MDKHYTTLCYRCILYMLRIYNVQNTRESTLHNSDLAASILCSEFVIGFYIIYMCIITEPVLCDDGLPKTDLEYKLQITCAH